MQQQVFCIEAFAFTQAANVTPSGFMALVVILLY